MFTIITHIIVTSIQRRVREQIALKVLYTFIDNKLGSYTIHIVQ